MPELTANQVLEIICRAGEFQRCHAGEPRAFERYLSGALRACEDAHGPQMRWARKSIESMRALEDVQ